jgi:hypothetical protein
MPLTFQEKIFMTNRAILILVEDRIMHVGGGLHPPRAAIQPSRGPSGRISIKLNQTLLTIIRIRVHNTPHDYLCVQSGFRAAYPVCGEERRQEFARSDP